MCIRDRFESVRSVTCFVILFSFLLRVLCIFRQFHASIPLFRNNIWFFSLYDDPLTFEFHPEFFAFYHSQFVGYPVWNVYIRRICFLIFLITHLLHTFFHLSLLLCMM